MARSDWRSRTRSRPRLRAPRGVNGRRRRIGRRGAQTNRGRGWEYLLLTWKRLGAGTASSAPSAPRPATSAAAVLASRGSGADMERRAPSGLSHRTLCGEQGKTRRAVEGGKEESKCPTPGRRKKKSPPRPQLSPKAVLAEKKKIAPFKFLFTFSSAKPSSGQAGAPSLSDHFSDLLFWRASRWPCSPGIWERTSGRR